MIQYTDRISAEEYLELRTKVGWMLFPLEEAENCIENAYMVISARDDGRAVGVARLLWDGGYVAFLSDVIVDPAYQRQGIGTRLLRSVLERYKTVYQMELLTDDTEITNSFYRSAGFVPAGEIGCLSFVRMKH